MWDISSAVKKCAKDGKQLANYPYHYDNKITKSPKGEWEEQGLYASWKSLNFRSRFQGLESTWNWFLVLESPWIFSEQDWKVLMLISFKVNERHWKLMIRYTEYKILEMLTKCLKTLVFCSQYPLVYSCMSIEQLVQSDVCTCFQALIHFFMCTCFC